MEQLVDDLPQFGPHFGQQFGIRVPSTISSGGSDSSLDGLQEEKAKLENLSFAPKPQPAYRPKEPNVRLNKFVRRLHEMLTEERDGGVVEWRRGLLILHNIKTFSKEVLPKYFNTRNFKTFRRQLNYYGFLHVRSFSSTGSATTALWVNKELADNGNDSISSVLQLKRVEPNEAAKTPEGRRERKNSAASSVEVDDFDILFQSYIDVLEAKTTTDVPKFVNCHQQLATPLYPSKTSYGHADALTQTQVASQGRSSDPLIDHAAGMLLSLARSEL